MKSSDARSEKSEVRVELKYCERCGGLWVRESGAGIVYCEKCQGDVEQLPVPKKKPGRIRLPLGPKSVVDDYGPETFKERLPDLKAAGGAA